MNRYLYHIKKGICFASHLRRVHLIIIYVIGLKFLKIKNSEYIFIDFVFFPQKSIQLNI